jgi:hypothetical protein
MYLALALLGLGRERFRPRLSWLCESVAGSVSATIPKMRG